MNTDSKNSATLSENIRQQIHTFTRPTVLRMLFLGFSAGIPILLIFSSLSLWLREAGLQRSAVTFFSWAALGYSFKFVWAPLVDKVPLPILTRMFGRRRSWMLFSQVFIIIAISWMGLTDPSNNESALTAMALAAVLLGFSSATQDIVIDAYRIESDTAEMQAILSATYIAGYRIAMIVSGAGALHLAKLFGSTMDSYSHAAWKWSYLIMASTMLIGVITTLLSPEPDQKKENEREYSNSDYIRFFVLFLILVASFIGAFILTSNVSKAIKASMIVVTGKALASFIIEVLRMGLAIFIAGCVGYLLTKLNLSNPKMLRENYVEPVKDFFERYGRESAILLLMLIGLYRVSDIVLGVISNVFYQDLGFTKDQIANVVKTFGVVMSIVGGFLGGGLAVKFGVIRVLFWGAFLSAATNLLFMALAQIGNNLPMLYLVISADNLAAGLASAAFVAFLSSLTNISFTAVQYAIFTSLMTLLPKLFGGYSGSIVDQLGYPSFFLITAVIGIPVLYLVHIAGKRLN